MILCVTLNPCLDKTLQVPPWQPGDVVRGSSVSEIVGGKGNNVARALKRLGKIPRPALFLGGPLAGRCESLLREQDGLDPLVCPVAASTRVITTVHTEGSNHQTAFFDPDPEITGDESTALYHRIEGAITADRVELMTLSGSSPSEATDGVYSDLISLARTHRIPVLLDTYGAALESIWGFWPNAMQLNRREAALHLRRPLQDVTDEDVFGLLDDWSRHGVTFGMVTDGPDSVLIQSRGKSYVAHPPEIEVVNPIGSGDCALAGLADGWLNGLEPLELVRHSLACAAANALVWDAGAIDPAEVQRLESTIEVEELDRPAPDLAAGALVRKSLGKRR